MEGLLSTGPTPSSLNTPRWRWHIYLGLHLIWTQSEEWTRASDRIPWPRLSEINGLLADCSELGLGEGRDYKQSFFCLNRVVLQPPAFCGRGAMTKAFLSDKGHGKQFIPLNSCHVLVVTITSPTIWHISLAVLSAYTDVYIQDLNMFSKCFYLAKIFCCIVT